MLFNFLFLVLEHIVRLRLLSRKGSGNIFSNDSNTFTLGVRKNKNKHVELVHQFIDKKGYRNERYFLCFWDISIVPIEKIPIISASIQKSVTHFNKSLSIYFCIFALTCHTRKRLLSIKFSIKNTLFVYFVSGDVCAFYAF